MEPAPSLLHSRIVPEQVISDARTYRAPTLALALAEVKRDLGAAAVILRTRSFRAGGFLGLGSKEVIEITASLSQSEPPRMSFSNRASAAAAYVNQASPGRTHPLATLAPFAPVDDAAANAIREELSSIKRLVGQLRDMGRPTGGAAAIVESGGLSDGIFADMVRMREARVPGHVIDAAVRAARGQDGRSATVRGRDLMDALAGFIPTVGEMPPATRQGGRPYTIALIGPTGVGKTTTVAKLAAAFRLRRGLNVGLLACDTYRIGAVEQLKSYADIIGLPFAVASSRSELGGAMATLGECDVVITDTAGRSQRDSGRVTELCDFVREAGPHETHLVLSAAASEEVSVRAIGAFGAAGPDRLIMTKLDEAESLGTIVGLAERAAVPISFVTTGQEVPDDIRVARSGVLARCILDASLSALLEEDPAP